MKLLAALMLVFVSFQSVHGSPPRLFSEKSFNAAMLVEAVNHYVTLGEETAVKELRSLAKPDDDTLGGIDMNERIGWVCRILFEPKGDTPLRPPGFGALSLPDQTMPLKSWPLYPVASAGASYFILGEGYTLDGREENLVSYIDDCRANGVFRKTKVAVPTRRQALQDADVLRRSEAWKSIKWKDSGRNWSYTLHEDQVWKFIQRQAEEIP